MLRPITAKVESTITSPSVWRTQDSAQLDPPAPRGTLHIPLTLTEELAEMSDPRPSSLFVGKHWIEEAVKSQRERLGMRSYAERSRYNCLPRTEELSAHTAACCEVKP